MPTPDPTVHYGGPPFQEAIEFFRQKVNLPTKHWDDLWQGMHARAFVVAGATKDELLSDFRAALDKAIANGTSSKEFLRDFKSIVKAHGWSYHGSPGWRARIIYQTNMRTAHQAGRYKQLTDPGILKRRPYWMYKHGGSVNPRPKHLSWHELVLLATDPWWDEHYPPNGWRCSCGVYALNARDLARMGKAAPDSTPDDGTYEWTNPRTGEKVEVPKGIDPGWAYNVGKAAWGQQLADETMAAWAKSKADAWERLTKGSWETEGRPERVPSDRPTAELGHKVGSATELEAEIEKALGGPTGVASFPVGEFTHAVHVSASTLVRHVDLHRAPFIPFLKETFEQPFEVWSSFERHRGTGLVVLRHRFIKAIDLGHDQAILLVAQAVGGQMEAWTFIPAKNLAYLQKQRVGKMIWGRGPNGSAAPPAGPPTVGPQTSRR